MLRRVKYELAILGCLLLCKILIQVQFWELLNLWHLSYMMNITIQKWTFTGGAADGVAGAEKPIDGHHPVVSPLIFRGRVVLRLAHDDVPVRLHDEDAERPTAVQLDGRGARPARRPSQRPRGCGAGARGWPAHRAGPRRR